MKLTHGHLVALALAALLLAGCGEASPRSEPAQAWSQEGKPASGRVVSFPGAAHCNWQDVTFLSLAWPLDRPLDPPRQDRDSTRVYIRDTRGVISDEFKAGFQASATLPADATFTGFSHAGSELWLSPSTQDSRAFVVNSQEATVEAWPRDPQGVACA